MKKLTLLTSLLILIIAFVCFQSYTTATSKEYKQFHKFMYSTGISGVSQAGCGCHGGSPNAGVGVSISGLPASPIQNQVYTLTLNVTGSNAAAGYNLSVSAGTLNVIMGDLENQLSGTELTHTTAKLLSGTPTPTASFSFEWTAPPVSAGNVTFYYAGNNVNANGNSGGDFWNRGSITVPMQTLPVKISSFTAVSGANNITNLIWTTELETNFEKYGIEHSCDGINFTTIGQVLPSTNTYYPKHYSFRHTAVNCNGTSYYRLKINNVSGSNEYSTIVTVKKQATTDQPFLYPNPAQNNAPIKVYTGIKPLRQVQIIAIDGKLIHTQINTGLLVQNVAPQQPLGKGNYFVVLYYNDGEKATLPLAVQ